MAAAIAPPMPYFGGKQILAARIARLLPTHRHYVEPFGGSLAVLLAKPRSVMETVNDLDADLMTFWRVLRERPAQLARVCALTPHSRREHELSYDRAGCDELEQARRVWVCLTQGRGGTLRATGWRHYVKPAGNTGLPDYLTGYVARIEPAAARLAGVSLECQPALEVIARYGAEPDVLLYVDPPYLGDARSTPRDPRRRTARYKHELLDKQAHRELADALTACRAAVVLSGYPSALYQRLYPGWHRVWFRAGTGQRTATGWSVRTEVVGSNRPLNTQPPLWQEVGEVR